ncbi:MAG TPA: hypothetical protein DCL21_04780 [Alphaproteobacteria bacterium]|nr:hypothetical protein [Alphaproteobacteria bacterium]
MLGYNSVIEAINCNETIGVAKGRRFSAYQALNLKEDHGTICYMCYQDQLKSNVSLLRWQALQVHHITSYVKLGLNKKKNSLLVCEKCHERLHLFIDMFTYENMANYDFLTTVFLEFFNYQESYSSFDERFSYLRYCESKKELWETFVEFIKSYCSYEVRTIFCIYFANYVKQDRADKKINDIVLNEKRFMKVVNKSLADKYIQRIINQGKSNVGIYSKYFKMLRLYIPIKNNFYRSKSVNKRTPCCQ